MVLALLWECCFVCIYTVYLFGKKLEPSIPWKKSPNVNVLTPIGFDLWACWCWAQTFPSFSSSCTVDEVVVFSRLLLSFKTCILKGVSSECEPVKLAYCGERGKKHQCVDFIWKPFLILTCYSFPSQFKKRGHILPHSLLIFKNVSAGVYLWILL